MKVRIRADGLRLYLPVPLVLIGYVIKMLPDKLFEDMRADVPEPYRALVSKANISLMATECVGILKANKGLEIVHVEAKDGTFISIRL